MLDDARLWLIGGLALASAAGRGRPSENKILGAPHRVAVELSSVKPKRGLTNVAAKVSGGQTKLYVSPGAGEVVSVYELGGDYVVVITRPGSSHISWERFDRSGQLLEDRFLHGVREASRLLGPDWATLRPIQIAKLLASPRIAA